MKTEPLTQERLKEILNYDLKSGEFNRKKSIGKYKEGQILKKPDYFGYYRVSVDSTQYRLHLLAWLWVYGDWPEKKLEHIDGDIHNNSIYNLREKTYVNDLQVTNLSPIQQFALSSPWK